MSRHGILLMRLTRVLGLNRLRETVIEPAVADMQHEYAREGSPGSRAQTLARGYWSILAGSALYVALLPSRHLRENWASRTAAGPRLLRQAWLPALVVLVLGYGYVGLMAATSTSEEWRLPAGTEAILFLSVLVMMTPPALALGIGWVLVRDPSCSRAAAAVGLLGAMGSFAYYDVAITRAIQAYKSVPATSARPHVGSGLTFRELGAATGGTETVALPASTCSCAKQGQSRPLHLEWHQRLSVPALAWSFALLAVGLSRTRRRAVVVLGLWPAYVGAIWTLRVAMPYALRGEIPVALAAWSAHLVPLSLVILLHAFGQASKGPHLDGYPQKRVLANG